MKNRKVYSIDMLCLFKDDPIKRTFALEIVENIILNGLIIDKRSHILPNIPFLVKKEIEDVILSNLLMSDKVYEIMDILKINKEDILEFYIKEGYVPKKLYFFPK